MLFVSPVGWKPSGGGNDAFTSLLLHCDGANGSTSFPDASSNGFAVTAGGTTVVHTTVKKFGTGSALFYGPNSWLSVPDNVALQFGTGLLTVDFWMRVNVLQTVMLYSKGRGDTAGSGFSIIQDASGSISVYASGSLVMSTGSAITADGLFHHIAVVRSAATSWKFFIDGTSSGTGGTANTNHTDTSALNIGGDSSAVYSDLNGWMDEIRVSKGIARWTSSFTPPTSAYS